MSNNNIYHNNNNSTMRNNRRHRTCRSSVSDHQAAGSGDFQNRYPSGGYRRSSTTAAAQNSVAVDDRSSNLNQSMDIDGFYYDPIRKRYFRIQNDHQISPASCAYTRGGLRFRVQETERQRLLNDAVAAAGPLSPGLASLLPAKRRQRFSCVDVPTLTARRQLNLIGERSMLRCLGERRAWSTPKMPTTICRAMQDQMDICLDRCQYIGASPTGDNILGCWSVSQSPWGTRIMCLNVETDAKKADERSYGLKLRPTDNFIYTLDRNVVDICQAKMDSAVTCVLYVTLPASERGSHIFLQPVPEMSNICDQEFLGSPIYNAHWEVPDTAWSCAFEPRHMRVSLGMEKCGIVVDMVSEKDFRLNSRQTNVLTQRFSKDGNLLFMGLRNNEILCSDLRLYHHRTVFTINQFSACFLGIMRDENYLMSANFQGQVKLWDLRQKRVVQEFSGLKNTYTKTPVVFNEEETVAFAVGEDGATQSWSLKTGRTLCKIPAPRPVTTKDDIPKLCYSNRWGDRFGNAGLCMAVGDSIYFYEMTL